MVLRGLPVLADKIEKKKRKEKKTVGPGLCEIAIRCEPMSVLWCLIVWGPIDFLVICCSNVNLNWDYHTIQAQLFN